MRRAARNVKPNATDMRLYRQVAHRGIHLVSPSSACAAQPAPLRTFSEEWLEQQQIREWRRLRMAAMAIGATFAPAVWLGHELLVHMHVL